MKISEPFRAIAPIGRETDKEFCNPRRELCQLFNEEDRLTKMIHAKVRAILAREYPQAMDEGKKLLLKIHEQL